MSTVDEETIPTPPPTSISPPSEAEAADADAASSPVDGAAAAAAVEAKHQHQTSGVSPRPTKPQVDSIRSISAASTSSPVHHSTHSVAEAIQIDSAETINQRGRLENDEIRGQSRMYTPRKLSVLQQPPWDGSVSRTASARGSSQMSRGLVTTNQSARGRGGINRITPRTSARLNSANGRLTTTRTPTSDSTSSRGEDGGSSVINYSNYKLLFTQLKTDLKKELCAYLDNKFDDRLDKMAADTSVISMKVDAIDSELRDEMEACKQLMVEEHAGTAANQQQLASAQDAVETLTTELAVMKQHISTLENQIATAVDRDAVAAQCDAFFDSVLGSTSTSTEDGNDDNKQDQHQRLVQSVVASLAGGGRGSSTSSSSTSSSSSSSSLLAKLVDQEMVQREDTFEDICRKEAHKIVKQQITLRLDSIDEHQTKHDVATDGHKREILKLVRAQSDLETQLNEVLEKSKKNQQQMKSSFVSQDEVDAMLKASAVEQGRLVSRVAALERGVAPLLPPVAAATTAGGDGDVDDVDASTASGGFRALLAEQLAAILQDSNKNIERDDDNGAKKKLLANLQSIVEHNVADAFVSAAASNGGDDTTTTTTSEKSPLETAFTDCIQQHLSPLSTQLVSVQGDIQHITANDSDKEKRLAKLNQEFEVGLQALESIMLGKAGVGVSAGLSSAGVSASSSRSNSDAATGGGGGGLFLSPNSRSSSINNDSMLSAENQQKNTHLNRVNLMEAVVDLQQRVVAVEVAMNVNSHNNTTNNNSHTTTTTSVSDNKMDPTTQHLLDTFDNKKPTTTATSGTSYAQPRLQLLSNTSTSNKTLNNNAADSKLSDIRALLLGRSSSTDSSATTEPRALLASAGVAATSQRSPQQRVTSRRTNTNNEYAVVGLDELAREGEDEESFIGSARSVSGGNKISARQQLKKFRDAATAAAGSQHHQSKGDTIINKKLANFSPRSQLVASVLKNTSNNSTNPYNNTSSSSPSRRAASSGRSRGKSSQSPPSQFYSHYEDHGDHGDQFVSSQQQAYDAVVDAAAGEDYDDDEEDADAYNINLDELNVDELRDLHGHKQGQLDDVTSILRQIHENFTRLKEKEHDQMMTENNNASDTSSNKKETITRLLRQKEAVFQYERKLVKRRNQLLDLIEEIAMRLA